MISACFKFGIEEDAARGKRSRRDVHSEVRRRVERDELLQDREGRGDESLRGDEAGEDGRGERDPVQPSTLWTGDRFIYRR